MEKRSFGPVALLIGAFLIFFFGGFLFYTFVYVPHIKTNNATSTEQSTERVLTPEQRKAIEFLQNTSTATITAEQKIKNTNFLQKSPGISATTTAEQKQKNIDFLRQ